MTAADNKVDVIIAHPLDGHTPGDRVSLSPDEAATYVNAAMARYASKTEAAKAEHAVVNVK